MTEEDAEEAHLWWSASLVCAAMKRPPPLAVANFHGAAMEIAAAGSGLPLMVTPYQARKLGVLLPDGLAYLQASDSDDYTSSLLAGARTEPLWSEYVYRLQALAACEDRTFRKACRRAQAQLMERVMRVNAYTADALTDAVVDRCVRCRDVWLARRAADGLAASKLAGTRHGGPPWAGAPTRPVYLSALRQARELSSGVCTSHLALFVLETAPREGPNGCGCAEADVECAAVCAYVLTERVGRTIMALDGVHDYSMRGEDPRADPSALLLHVAARWWTSRASAVGSTNLPVDLPLLSSSKSRAPPRRKPMDVPAAAEARELPVTPQHTPLWMNDGPIPTAGLLRYKSQYHGGLLHALALSTARERRAAARARWEALWRSHCQRQPARRRHVGVRNIHRAAARIYAAHAESVRLRASRSA